MHKAYSLYSGIIITAKVERVLFFIHFFSGILGKFTYVVPQDDPSIKPEFRYSSGG